MVARSERISSGLLVGVRRARVDLDVRALEEAPDPAAEALPAAQDDGIRPELRADLREHLLERCARGRS